MSQNEMKTSEKVREIMEESKHRERNRNQRGVASWFKYAVIPALLVWFLGSALVFLQPESGNFISALKFFDAVFIIVTTILMVAGLVSRASK